MRFYTGLRAPRFMLVLVTIYKQGISPLLPGSCRFVPTCSSYAADAFQMHGVLRGCVLALVIGTNVLDYQHALQPHTCVGKMARLQS